MTPEGVPPDEAPALQKLREALTLIADKDPPRFAQIQRDVAWIMICGSPRFRGEYLHELRLCHLYQDWLEQSDTHPAEVAMVVAHEAMHARLFSLGIGYPTHMQPRIERLCTAAEIALGKKLSAAGTQLVEARRRQATAEYVWGPEARQERRVQAMEIHKEELRSLGAPEWLVRQISRLAKLGGLTPRAGDEGP
jgi:hypothetical protein